MVIDTVDIEAPDWDEETIQSAYTQARLLMQSDPESASLILSQAQAAQRKSASVGQKVFAGREPYDPMKLYARMGKYYAWMSKDAIDAMDFRTFFGYVRESNIMRQEEADAYKNARNGVSNGDNQDIESALRTLPQAQEYTGETIAL